MIFGKNLGTEAGTAFETSPTAIVGYLQHHGAASAVQIADYMGLNADIVKVELGRLVQSGALEILRPVCAFNEPSPRTADLEYYRWKRNTDADYVWQKSLREPLADSLPLRRIAILLD